MPKGVRVQRRHACPRPECLHELPEPLPTDPSFDALATLPLVRDHEERRCGGRACSLGGEILAEDGARGRRQEYRHLMPALALDPTQPKIWRDVSHIERRYLAPAEPPVGHERKNGALAYRALLQEGSDRRPRGHGGYPRFTTRARQLIQRIADQLVAANGPPAEAAERGEADADRVALEPAPGQVVLVVATGLRREVRHEHRYPHLLHD